MVIALLTISAVNATGIGINDTVSDSEVHESCGTSHSEDYDNHQTTEETVAVNDNDAVGITNSYKSINSNNTNVKSIKPLKSTKNEGNILSYSPEDGEEVTVRNYTDLYNVISAGKKVITLEGDEQYIANQMITISSSVTINGNNRIITGTPSDLEHVFSISEGVNVIINNLKFENNLFKGEVVGDIDNCMAGLIINYGSLKISNSYFNNNSAIFLGNDGLHHNHGATIYNKGYLTILDSIFTENKGDCGGSIYNGGSLNISYCNFTNNSLHYGGAIYNKGSFNISYCNFTNNVVAQSGGAIYQGSNKDSVIENCNFDRNEAVNPSTSVQSGTGGAICCGSGSIIKIINSDFTNSVSKYQGGAIYIGENLASVVIDNSKFINNVANMGTQGGAIYQGKTSTLKISNSKFEDNYAYAGAAILQMDSSKLDIFNSSFDNNRATSGSAIFQSKSIYTNISCSNFTNNIAGKDNGIGNCGGTIYFTSNIIINGCEFLSNSGSGHGGALATGSGSTNVFINNSKFINNFVDVTSSYGGAIYTQNPSAVFNITNTLFKENNAQMGGSITALASKFSIENSKFDSNYAGYGGIATLYAIYNIEMSLNNVTMHNNYATATSTSAAGAFYIIKYNYVPKLTIANSTLNGTRGYSVISNGGSVEISYSNLTKNNANQVLLLNSGTMTLSHNTVVDNCISHTSNYIIHNNANSIININNNLFINNTNNKRDMLLNNHTGRTFNVGSNNVYVDNYLEDYWNVTTDVVDVISNEETPIHVINLRDVYNNVIVNGTIICYLEGEEFGRFDVKDGDALVTLTESPSLGLGEHTFELEYQSLSKHYQNLIGGALRVELRINLKPEPVNVTKIWRDDDPSNRQEITINLYKNGALNQTTTLNEANNWTHSFIDLAKYENGKLITYTIDETNIPEGYIKSITNNTPYNFTITNIKTINISVNNIWDDNENQEGIRPSSVNVNLIADGVVIDTIALNDGNLWKHTFTKLPMFKEDGKLIKYTFTEVDVPGYSLTVTDNNYEFTITSTHGSSKAKIHYVVINDIEGKVSIEIKVYDENDDEIPNSKLNITIDNETTSTIIKTNRIYQNTTLTTGEHTITAKYLGTEIYGGTNELITFTVVSDPNALKTNITLLENKIKELDTLQTDVTTLKELIGNLNGQITILNNKINTLNSTIQNQNVTKINQTLQELKQQLNNLINNNLTQLQTNITNLENKIQDLEKLQTDITSLETKIKELEKLQTNITTLNKVIQNINDEIIRINNTINTLNSTVCKNVTNRTELHILKNNTRDINHLFIQNNFFITKINDPNQNNNPVNPSPTPASTKTSLTLKTVKKLSKELKN